MTHQQAGAADRGITFEIFETYERMSHVAADVVVEAARHERDMLWCAAAGSTPIRTYELLALRHRADREPLRHVRVLKLDEWGGLSRDDPATCEQYLQRRILQPLDVQDDRYVGFNGNPEDPEIECQRIRQWVAQHGPIDLCLLGLGENGHIGFNEPNQALVPFSHVADLSAYSRQHSMLEAARQQPGYGFTLGMAEILQARQILLLVSGAHKREALERLTRRSVSAQFPASLLWLHPRVRCLCDRKAAGPSLSHP